MEWKYDDGGREAAGFKGKTGDCVVRAIAIAAQMDYRDVYDRMNEMAKQEKPSKKRRGASNARTGVHRVTYERFLDEIGWAWVPTMQFGKGCTHHLRKDELPAGRIICRCSKHLCAVIDGTIHDTFDPSRKGKRCVYGYWTKRSE